MNEVKVSIGPKSDPAKSEAVALAAAVADFSQASYAAAQAIDANEGTGWAVHPETGKPHELAIETKSPVGAAGDSVLTITISQQYTDGLHNLGHFRLSASTSPHPATGSKLPAPIAEALAVPTDKRSDAQKQVLAALLPRLDGDLARLTADVQRSADQLRTAA